jgi:hypothetical protein
MSWAHLWMFRIAINQLFEWLFSRVLASRQGGLGLIPGQNMSFSDLQVRMEMTLFKSLHSGDPDVIQNTQPCKASARLQTIRRARLARLQ